MFLKYIKIYIYIIYKYIKIVTTTENVACSAGVFWQANAKYFFVKCVVAISWILKLPNKAPRLQATENVTGKVRLSSLKNYSHNHIFDNRSVHALL